MSKYQNCFVAFLDILGFESKVMDSISKDKNDTLKTLIETLNICGAFPSIGMKRSEEQKRFISVQSRFFSDTIVFFMKENSDDISQLFFIIRYLQDRLWEKKICLRGAVTLGEMYWPYEKESITLGPALIDAYRLESRIAIFPRILVSKKLHDYLETKNVSASPYSKAGKLKDFIIKDFDGEYILDLLNKQVTRKIDEELEEFKGPEHKDSFTIRLSDGSKSNYKSVVKNVETLIKVNINADEEKIRQKYQWLKSYMDICKE